MDRDADQVRRDLLKIGVALGGGLLLGVRFINPDDSPAGGEGGEKGVFAPNAWVRIGSDDSVTIIIDRSEMGQGVVTSLAMLVAEELEVELDQVRTEFAPAEPAYINPLTGTQVTGGSTSVRAAWLPLRQAGAVARELLISAAAATWGVDRSGCRAERGTVLHVPGNKRLRYGQLATKASTLTVPDRVRLKQPSEFRLIGRPAPSLDAPDKVMGRTVFGIDIMLPGQMVAVVARCPVFGGRPVRVDASQTKAVPGVCQVLEIESGIAVVADSFWSALQGRDALRIDWDEGAASQLTSADIDQRFIQAATGRGEVTRDHGDARKLLKRAQRVIEADYEAPYLAHAAMEPMNCTAHVTTERCELWVPTQNQSDAKETAAHYSGLHESAVRIHTTFIGGGFGRRLRSDFVAEAVQIAKGARVPVQLIWTLEDDLQHDYYRPGNYTRLQATLDEKGQPLAWLQRIVGPALSLGGVDVPYAIPNIREEHVELDPGIPTGPWRSVGASQNAFAVECFIDELAHATGADPYEYRHRLLAHVPRYRAVLELAARKADWGTPLPQGRGRGIALYYSFASWVAEVAEVLVSPEGMIKVERVVCAIDCGMTVNPDTIRAQLEGAVAFALTAALKGEITIDGGRVEQSNFHDYPLLTLAEMPEVEVHIVPSSEPPGGVGEPGVPPLGPAVANAVFDATGQRLRRQPLRIATSANED